jgi:hypothetical protein
MNEQLEQHLRGVFREDASHAPAFGVTAGEVMRPVQRQRRVRWAMAGVGVSLAVAAVAAGSVLLPTPSDAPAGNGSANVAADRHGALPDSRNADCAFTGSPAEVAARPMSFDGTVTAVGAPITDQPTPEDGYLPVTFAVNEWFRGGAGTSVTVAMRPPLAPGEVAGEPRPSYGVGTRLLVSGEQGAPALGGMLANGCGFTRYYDQQTATAWRNAAKAR